MSTKGGLIKIETSKIDDQIAIKVIDNGYGIKPEYMEHLFDPFFTTKDVGKGTGLGLGIVNSIIEDMKGKISIESKPDEGSVFTIKLPLLVDKKETVKPEIETAVYNPIAGKALVADDEEELRYLLGDQLIKMGLTVDMVDDGDTALEKLKTRKFDFLFLDLKMPRMSGESLLSEMENLGISGTKVLIITGGIEIEENVERFNKIKKQTNGFIKKPYNKKDIHKILSELTKV